MKNKDDTNQTFSQVVEAEKERIKKRLVRTEERLKEIRREVDIEIRQVQELNNSI